MKTATYPISYNQATIFFWKKFYFSYYDFLHEKAVFYAEILTDRYWGNVFFGSFCSHSLVSADSTEKFFPWEVLLLRIQPYFLEHCTSILKKT